MKRGKLAFLIGAIILLLLVSLFIYSQIIAQDGEQITQAEFADILMQVMGLGEMLPDQATIEYKVRLLTDRGYSPLDGWQLDEILTKENVAVVFVSILRIPDIRIGGFVQVFVDMGCMTPGREHEPFTLPELIAFIECLSGSSGGRVNPYQEDVSPLTE